MAVDLIIGDTWQGDVTVDGTDGDPINLTGASYEMEWRRTNGVEVLAGLTTVETLDAEAGTLLWTVTDEDTAGLDPGTLRGGLRVTLADGTAWTVLDMTVAVKRGPVQ